MKPIITRIQNYYTQTGVSNEVVFMWKYGEGTHRQTAYKIDIFCAGKNVCTTGKVISCEQNNIALKLDLEEQTEYEYTISVWDEADELYVSDKAAFITGVRSWRGEWIGNGTKKPFIASKRFNVEQIEKAVLSVCVPGQYEVRLNNRKISPFVYEGTHTDFNKHVHYNTYNITDFLVVGENELSVEVANGWYIADDDNGKRFFYTIDKGYEAFGDQLALLVQMKLGDEYIVSGTDWEVSASRTTLADIYGSEDMDYTLDYKWERARTVAPPKGEVIPAAYPPITCKKVYTPINIDRERGIFDFGQNMSSQFRLKIKGKRGQVVKVIPAEKLNADGDICQTVNTYSLLTLSGGVDIFEQRFSVNGARWYKIEGADVSDVLEFESCFVTSSAKQSGYFKCSDENLNKIFEIILNAIDSNLNHSHTDCPTIEKLGWLEPDHLMGKAVMYLKDVDTLWSKIAMDMRDSQYKDDEFDIDNGAFPHEYKAGLVPSIAPRYAKFITDWKQGSFWDIIPWGSSIILAAYEQYLFYGNTKVLLNNYESAKRYIDYLTNQYNDYNSLYKKEGKVRFICAGLGDWGTGQNKGESRENIETAFYYHDLMIMAEISKILGKGEEIFYLEQAENVKTLYNEALLVDEGNTAYYVAYDNGNKTQANQAIPLMFGLVPEELRDKVSKSLIELCEGEHLKCGEIGLVYILRALSALDRDDIIYEMILKEEHPSYLRFVKCGETTLPEFWRDDARSRNHDMMGHIMEWFFTGVAGISCDAGFKNVKIAPKCMKLVESLECEYDSIRGKIKVSYADGELKVCLPNNVNMEN